MTRETLPDVDLGALPGLVGYHLRMAQLTVFKDFDRELADVDMTPAIFGALEVLCHNKGLTQTRLANAIGLDRSSLVPLLDKLQKRNLVAREASVKDRRSNHLFLTPEGRQLLAKANKRVQLHEQRILASLSKAEIKQLIKLLSKIGPAATDADA
ncbi:MAG TPA: MarR family transcriptional regulator [Oxalobacteraceae bacterium]|nr:MarR family transcriptional regulator [Oxalobacteraceae bacterium]